MLFGRSTAVGFLIIQCGSHDGHSVRYEKSVLEIASRLPARSVVGIVAVARSVVCIVEAIAQSLPAGNRSVTTLPIAHNQLPAGNRSVTTSGQPTSGQRLSHYRTYSA